MAIRCYLMFRQRSKVLQTISPSTASPRLEALCTTCVQVLVFLWMILGCLNLLVALRAPTCLRGPLEEWQNDLKEHNWRFGLSCRLHRALVALSILMAIFMAYLSFLDQQHLSHRKAGVWNCYCACLPRNAPQAHAPALSISSSRSGFSVEKNDHLFLIPERRSSRLEHEQWLQRRNSLSSQKAIYPHKYYYYDHRHKYQPYALSQGSRYSSTLRSVSEGQSLDLHDRNSSLCSSQSSRSASTRRPTHPSPMRPRSRANSNPERGDLRRDPATISATSDSGVPEVPPLPIAPAPTWSPALQHAPLSADPTIRALSTGSGLAPSLLHSKSSPDLRGVQPENVHTASTLAMAPKTKGEAVHPSSTTPCASTKRAMKTSTEAISPRKPATPMPTVPPPAPPSHRPVLAITAPAIPARAPGHSTTTPRARPQSRVGTKTATRSRSASTSATTSRSNLRRPSPIRHRHYHHPHPHHYHQQPATHGLSATQNQLPLQHYQHQRVWRRENSTTPSSIYSASSYGTERTVSVVTRGSTSTRTPTAAAAGYGVTPSSHLRPGVVAACR
ncbi:hypothetical protein Z517_00510 [Fonsecaea pedrosoi CBS 271.37]|uniref:Uncharacterized protein n=1 Tax=Fonsecaea pedrosoi CBS 271.37 TaxID=1442368 RepID=A0A0D2E4W6_9EURO|nr:uncharacterized protein Z517_00510 [Fonsecaea pedrosoi CBS 271.37]KIW85121.1 hypothetical protein Z517_00510 [Fonsecaea pedrosoi CBS 271.37]